MWLVRANGLVMRIPMPNYPKTSLSDALREAAQALWNAIDQEYDVDDGIPNFSSDIGEAYTNLGLVLQKVRAAKDCGGGGAA